MTPPILLLQVSVSLLVAFALGCGYLGILFSKLAVAVPSAQSMDEIGAAAMGKTGKRLVYALAGSAIVVDPIALHIVSMLAVQQIFPALGTLAASAVVAACMLPLAQIQVGAVGGRMIILRHPAPLP